MKIFVGCSSSNDINKKYLEEAVVIAQELVKEDVSLVFGCNDEGIMGVFFNEFKKNNKMIYGYNIEIYNKQLDCETMMLENISKRTEKILFDADMYLFLPGGIGTYQELITAIDNKRTFGINKKIIIYNYNNFYDKILEIIDDLYKNNFCNEKVLDAFKVCTTRESLLQNIREMLK